MKLPSIKTDLIEVTNQLNTGCRVFFKKDSQQPSGSFKLRGIGNFIANAIEKVQSQGKDIHVFSSSGGNAGLAAAYSSQFYGVKCTVVLPKLVKASVVETLKQYGATVYIRGDHWGQTDQYLRDELIGNMDTSKVSPVYCHPFDDPLIWEGHGTMISEIEQQLCEADLNKVKGIICCVGGGGLFSGILDGIRKSKSLTKVPILTVETSGAASFDLAIKNDKVVHLDTVQTYATSLGAPYVCQEALEGYRTHPVKNCVIEDLDSVRGTLYYYDTFGEVVEPACGASISMVSKNKKYLEFFKDLQPDDIIITIVCGGTVTKELDLDSYRQIV